MLLLLLNKEPRKMTGLLPLNLGVLKKNHWELGRSVDYAYSQQNKTNDMKELEIEGDCVHSRSNGNVIIHKSVQDLFDSGIIQRMIILGF